MLDSLKDKHFHELCRLMVSHTGIQLPPTKRTMLEGRLRKRVRVLGLDSLEDYGALLFDGGRLDEEFPYIVDNVTTNKTDFFREPAHFDALRTTLIPSLLADRSREPTLKLWSAACSMGAEAYTMAMVLDGMQKDTPFPFAILGTDISRVILEQARRAVFPLAMLDMIPPGLRSLYTMQPSNPDRHEFRIVSRLRRRVRFEHLNLMDADYPFDTDIDVIFLRNVLIYFAKPEQHRVLMRLSAHLRPGGYLVLGHSESFAVEEKGRMVQVAPTVFRRAAGRSAKGRAA